MTQMIQESSVRIIRFQQVHNQIVRQHGLGDWYTTQGSGILQVPMTCQRLPPAKFTLPESLFLSPIQSVAGPREVKGEVKFGKTWQSVSPLPMHVTSTPFLSTASTRTLRKRNFAWNVVPVSG
jgi:hypothetical protein